MAVLSCGFYRCPWGSNAAIRRGSTLSVRSAGTQVGRVVCLAASIRGSFIVRAREEVIQTKSTRRWAIDRWNFSIELSSSAIGRILIWLSINTEIDRRFLRHREIVSEIGKSCPGSLYILSEHSIIR